MVAVSWPLEHDIPEFDGGIGFPTRVEQAPNDIEESSREGRGIHGGQAYRGLSCPSAAVGMTQNGHMGRTLGLLVLVGVLVIPLAGCAPDRGPIATPSGSTDGTDSPTATATPTATPTLGPEEIPFEVACADVVSDELIYEWGSGNWASDPSFSVAAGSSAETIVEHGGTACGWVNLTSGEKLTVAIGEFAPETLDALRQERAANADAVSDFGGDGYFLVASGTGQADAFTGSYWITASSTWFLSAGDAVDIVNAAISATN